MGSESTVSGYDTSSEIQMQIASEMYDCSSLFYFQQSLFMKSLIRIKLTRKTDI